MIKITVHGDVDHRKSTLIGCFLKHLSVGHQRLEGADLAFEMEGLSEECVGHVTVDIWLRPFSTSSDAASCSSIYLATSSCFAT